MPDEIKHVRLPDGDLFPGFSGEIGRVGRAPDVSAIEDLPTEYEAGGPADTENRGYIGLTVSNRRLTAFFAILALGLTVVVLRIAQVQMINGEYYSRQAEGNRSRVVWIPSERGIIYDRNGTPLVQNVPNFALVLKPAELPTGIERGQLLARLAGIIGGSPDDIEQKLSAKDGGGAPGSVVVSDRLSHDQAVLLIIEAAKNNGISLEVGTRRDYLTTKDVRSLSHVIGFEGRPTEQEMDSDTEHYLASDQVGKTGLEKFYETTLRGHYGQRVMEIDAFGRVKKIISEESGAAGKNLVLSIDLEMQKKAESLLKEQLRAIGKTRGSLIVLKPDTGEVLAMVSVPDFDSNLFAQGISNEDFRRLADDRDNPMFPRAVAAALPSGSVFKMVVASAALEEGLINAATSVLSTGGIRVDKWFFPDWKAGGHGPTNVVKALAESVNTFFYAIGGGWEKITGLGVEKIIVYARKFGLGEKLGVDVAGEGGGFLPSKQWKEETKGEHWYVGDTYHLAIGQGDILVTPLQIAAMTAVFANGGKLIQPRLVNALTSSDGSRAIREPQVLNAQVVSKQAIDTVRQGMRRAVTNGSATSLGSLPVAVAAKTGTAQWSNSREPHAWFTAFAPYVDPEVVVTVVIEEGGEGSQTAAPVAKRFLAWYFGPR
jgi:penicillin-binding protein 2